MSDKVKLFVVAVLCDPKVIAKPLDPSVVIRILVVVVSYAISAAVYLKSEGKVLRWIIDLPVSLSQVRNLVLSNLSLDLLFPLLLPSLA